MNTTTTTTESIYDHPLYGEEVDINYSEGKRRYQVAKSHGEHCEDPIPEDEIFAEFMYVDDAVDYAARIGMILIQSPVEPPACGKPLATLAEASSSAAADRIARDFERVASLLGFWK